MAIFYIDNKLIKLGVVAAAIFHDKSDYFFPDSIPRIFVGAHVLVHLKCSPISYLNEKYKYFKYKGRHFGFFHFRLSGLGCKSLLLGKHQNIGITLEISFLSGTQA